MLRNLMQIAQMKSELSDDLSKADLAARVLLMPKSKPPFARPIIAIVILYVMRVLK